MNQRVLDEMPRFLERAQAIVTRETEARGWPARRLDYDAGARWIRMTDGRGSRFGFVDGETGDVRYASTWSKPGPVRGSIFAEDEAGLGIRWHGVQHADGT